MRNILLHTAVHGETAADGALIRVRVLGHAFGLQRLVVTLEGPRGGIAVPTIVHPRTFEWVAEFHDAEALRRAGVGVGVRVRVVAADMDDEAGCFSSTTAVVEGP
jgi:citrate lyase beta subunit